MSWTVARLVEATGGKLLSGSLDAAVGKISTDTRNLQPGDAFVALLGESHDGHDFIDKAVAQGAGALIVQHERLSAALPPGVAAISVPDTLCALGDLAGYWRRSFSIPVVGITGSNGKTSTKEMIAAILSRSSKVLKNQGNFNNLIGVPLTLLSLSPQHEMAVVEMGINVPGEMERLARMCRPTAALITNIHTAHLEGLQSLDMVAGEKGKLWQSLRAEDLAVVNLDDERLERLSKSIECRKVTYSVKDSSADVHMVGQACTDGLASVFQLAIGADLRPVRLPVLGAHQVQNAVAAAAVAWGLGVSPGEIAAGLSQHQPVDKRMQVIPLKDGTILVNDTYNANPASMLAAIRAVASARDGKTFIAVLGEMRELGENRAALHRDVGRQLGGMGVERLVTLGDLAREIAAGAVEAGMPSGACYHGKSHEDIVSYLRDRWAQGAWILVKGSRGMTMERVVQGILSNDVPECSRVA